MRRCSRGVGPLNFRTSAAPGDATDYCRTLRRALSAPGRRLAREQPLELLLSAPARHYRIGRGCEHWHRRRRSLDDLAEDRPLHGDRDLELIRSQCFMARQLGETGRLSNARQPRSERPWRAASSSMVRGIGRFSSVRARPLLRASGNRWSDAQPQLLPFPEQRDAQLDLSALPYAMLPLLQARGDRDIQTPRSSSSSSL